MVPPSRIIYGKPRIKDILKNGYSLVDMHSHTRLSDGLSPLRRVLKVAEKKGIGLSITDHQDIRAYSLLPRMRFKNLIIPGMEINLKEGPHVLVYFYDVPEMREFYTRHIKRNISLNPNGRTRITIDMLTDFISDYNCISAMAHPVNPLTCDFRKLMKSDPDSIRKIHAIEAISGSLPRYYMKRSMKLALDSGKMFVAGSDAHSTSEIGNALCYSYADDVGSFLDNIRKKRNYVIGMANKMTHRIKVIPTYIRHAKYIKSNIGTVKIMYDDKIKNRFRPLIGKGINFAHDYISDTHEKIKDRIMLRKR